MIRNLLFVDKDDISDLVLDIKNLVEEFYCHLFVFHIPENSLILKA